MKISDSSRSDRIWRRFTVKDGPVVDHPNSLVGKKVRVKAVTIEYTLNEDGIWRISGSWAAHIEGPVLKKDGTEGAVEFSARAAYGWNSGHPQYDWLRKIVIAGQPRGKADAATYNGFEVT